MNDRDDNGQWILLSAVVIAIAIGLLYLLLNPAMMTGHSTANSVMAVPKDKIRDLNYQAITEAQIIGYNANIDYDLINGANPVMPAFNASYDHFLAETGAIYQNHGIITNVKYQAYTNSENLIDNVTLSILYNDGNTIYLNNQIIGIEGK